MQKALLQLHLAVLFAGLTGVLGRIITLNEGLLVWYRLALSVPILALLMFYKKAWVSIPGKDVWRIFGIGVIAALHWVTFYASIKYANVSVALVCFSAIGFFTAIFEPLINKTSFSIRELLLGLLPIVGISLIFQFDPSYQTGIIIGLIAAVLGSLFPILNGRQVKKHSTWMVTFYYLFGGLLFLTILLPFYLKVFPPTHVIPTTIDWMGLLVLSVICTVWAMLLSMNALKYISAFTVNLSYNLEPLYGILLAFMLYREDKGMGTYFYLGLAFIVVSVALQTYFVFISKKKT
ncbi:DMT family transporter [Gynurincola endophyticus]|jgi:drug/metabolite transporter (DMT)-like permease|uniref:DMT family transporter n=1 Tax=Gynurincola endophyticus TaxID=2479004 RepID=UPI000F8CB743|nr:DMT family transporter [Gynurincola endophyticus]